MTCIIRPVIGTLNQKDKATVLFAAEEIQKYLCTVSGGDFSVVPTDRYTENDKDSLYVGINILSLAPEVEDSRLDDAVYIDCKGLAGIITGSNARSVLIAAYRYLKELGFSFIRPGKDGEYYPDKLTLRDVFVSEKASYRHRAVCIEGSVFQKNLMDIIDWIPKAAMSGYFIQFQLPREFFDRWYLCDTPYRDKVQLFDDDIRAIVAMGEAEIEKRSLLYHGVGHGWTTQAFGIDGSSWSVHDEPEEKYRDVLALVNGKRALWDGIPLNTNLCYSNPKARERVTDNIVDYCRNHPGITYLHFWLADGVNNNCECDECRKKRTSDYYVQMLNSLDEKLSAENIDTKIVFLIYVDLLWKPLYERLKNPDRFVLMFAPISRSYSESFDPDSTGEMSPYELNKLQFPVNVGENIAYLRDWQKDFACDSFDFDYHFMWDHYYDFAQYRHAQILCNDIKNLSGLGLNGIVSCQVQRTFTPTSLSMNILAQTLWNKDIDFDEFSDKVLKTEFGSDYSKVKSYLASLSELGCARVLRREADTVCEKNVQSLAMAIEVIDKFEPVIEANINKSDSFLHSWQKLKFHAQLYRMMLLLYLEAAKGNGVGAFSHITDFALKNEEQFKDEFDATYFVHTFATQNVRNLKNLKDY